MVGVQLEQKVMNALSRKFRSGSWKNSLQIVSPKVAIHDTDGHTALAENTGQINKRMDQNTQEAQERNMTTENLKQPVEPFKVRNVHNRQPSQSDGNQVKHMKTQLSRVRNALNTKNNKVEELVVKLKEAHKKIDGMKVLVQINETLKKNVQTLERKVLKLQKQLEEETALGKEKSYEIKNLKWMLGMIKGKFRQEDQIRTQLAQKHKQIRMLQYKCKDLSEKYSDGFRMTTHKLQENQHLQDEVMQLKCQLRQLRFEVLQMNKQKSNLNRRLSESQLNIKRLSHLEDTILKREATQPRQFLQATQATLQRSTNFQSKDQLGRKAEKHAPSHFKQRRETHRLKQFS